MDKVLFLDHDGVICLPKNFGSRFNADGDGIFDSFDKKAVKILNQIIEETNCEIVVSSDWRLFEELPYLTNHYIINGIIKPPIAYCPSFAEDTDFGKHSFEELRSREINSFVQEYNIKQWCAIDDMDLSLRDVTVNDNNFRFGLTNFVHTSRVREGIKQTGVKDKIINFLKEQHDNI